MLKFKIVLLFMYIYFLKNEVWQLMSCWALKKECQVVSTISHRRLDLEQWHKGKSFRLQCFECPHILKCSSKKCLIFPLRCPYCGGLLNRVVSIVVIKGEAWTKVHGPSSWGVSLRVGRVTVQGFKCFRTIIQVPFPWKVRSEGIPLIGIWPTQVGA